MGEWWVEVGGVKVTFVDFFEGFSFLRVGLGFVWCFAGGCLFFPLFVCWG